MRTLLILTIIACLCSVLSAKGLKAEDLMEGSLDSKEYADAKEEEKDEDDNTDFTERDNLLESILKETTTPRNSFKYTHKNVGVKFPRLAVIRGNTFQISNNDVSSSSKLFENN